MRLRDHLMSRPPEQYVWDILTIDLDGNRTELRFPNKNKACECVSRMINSPDLAFVSMAKRLA